MNGLTLALLLMGITFDTSGTVAAVTVGTETNFEAAYEPSSAQVVECTGSTPDCSRRAKRRFFKV